MAVIGRQEIVLSQGTRQWFDGLQRCGIRLGLESVERLLALAGDPHRGMRFIHVAGTDGKGSVCAMMESVLRCSGYRVGAFTSPHILKMNESIRVDGKDIPDDDLDSVLGVLRPHVESMEADGVHCTSFEVLTAAALLYFRESRVDIAVVEVGMGGRLDSTNVIMPDVTVINNIGLEHTEFLGGTIEEVAKEKAGIMKAGVPCVTLNPDDVAGVLSAHAASVGCSLTRVRESDIGVISSGPDGLDMSYRGEIFHVALPGRFQARNAALAIEALRHLPDSQRTEGHMAEGLAAVRWQCRMQRIPGEPVIIDVTHTLNGARCLRSDVSEIYGEVVLVLAMLSDKDIRGVAAELSKVAARAFVSQPASPRAARAEDVAAALSEHMHVDGVFGTVGEAIDAAIGSRDGRYVLVTGSFRTAEDALKWLQKRSVRY